MKDKELYVCIPYAKDEDTKIDDNTLKTFVQFFHSKDDAINYIFDFYQNNTVIEYMIGEVTLVTDEDLDEWSKKKKRE